MTHTIDKIEKTLSPALTYGQAGYILSLFEQHLMHNQQLQPHYAQKIIEALTYTQHPNAELYLNDTTSETVLIAMNAQHNIHDKATFAQIRLNAAAQTTLDCGDQFRIRDIMNMSIQEITTYAHASVKQPSLRQYLKDWNNINDFTHHVQAHHNMFGMRYLNHHHNITTQRAAEFPWENSDGDVFAKANAYLGYAYNV